MTEVDDRAVRTALEAEVDRLAVPSPDLPALLTGGRAAARSRRRRVGAGLAAAVLAAVVGGAVAAQPGLPGAQEPAAPASESSRTPASEKTGPATLGDLPDGDAPAWPYFSRGRLHTGEVTVEAGSAARSLVVGGGTVVTRTVGQSGRWSVQLVDPPSGVQTVLTDQAAGPPVVGVDGRYVAWPVDASVPGTTAVQLWDVEQGSGAGTVTFPFEGVCCDNPFRLLGIDAQARVYGAGFAQGRDRTWVGEVGSEASALEGVARGYVTEVTAWGVVVALEPASKNARTTQVLGRVDATGNFREVDRVPSPQAAVSWSGAAIAYVDAARLMARDIDSGREQTLLLPRDVDVLDLLWEPDDRAVLVRVTDGDRDAWVRCDAESGACELAAALPRPYELPGR